MRYCEISKEMSLLYFGLAVFCPFEARDPEFDKQPLPPPIYCLNRTLNTASNFGTLASNWQNTSNTKYNRDISLLIQEYFVSHPHLWLVQFFRSRHFHWLNFSGPGIKPEGPSAITTPRCLDPSNRNVYLYCHDTEVGVKSEIE
jgi:hypothetical protein